MGFVVTNFSVIRKSLASATPLCDREKVVTERVGGYSRRTPQSTS